MKRLLPVILLFSILSGNAQESPNPDILAYIERYRTLAVDEMVRTGVPAAIKLAQGIIETQAGMGELVSRSNNHFGIKCKSSWTGERTYHDDDEKGECFRKYATAEDSWRDHSDFLRTQPRYAFLFRLDPTDYTGWAKGLKSAGYATDPRYPERLIRYIESYRLNELTLTALSRKNGGVETEVKSAVAADTLAVPPAPMLHRVAPGETLYGLSRRYGVDMKEIMRLNGLTSDALVAGSDIRIPAK
jgi:LysM repeat protein